MRVCENANRCAAGIILRKMEDLRSSGGCENNMESEGLPQFGQSCWPELILGERVMTHQSPMHRAIPVLREQSRLWSTYLNHWESGRNQAAELVC